MFGPYLTPWWAPEDVLEIVCDGSVKGRSSSYTTIFNPEQRILSTIFPLESSAWGDMRTYPREVKTTIPALASIMDLDPLNKGRDTSGLCSPVTFRGDPTAKVR
jgi:hypothetical protein